ncbi:cytochrome b/b6 domain-containing protein [Microbacterium sp. P05]|uniref:cytochrome b/b6 domain-containing protein n=1 Tax=Microbacterium sp. P05 TaxID=3366948 RepID=UPI003745A252
MVTAGDAGPRGRAPEPKRYGRFTRAQWISAALLGAGALVVAAAVVVLIARSVIGLEPVRDFVATYPGEYALPAAAPIGIPAWLGWQHFFNTFLLVLILRSGWTARYGKRPPVLWSSRRVKRRKMSLTVWFHLALDALWIVNGVVYVVLLFATGQWVKIVPTSWEVVPNAVSAGLQYLSLDWPTGNGWVNYNALQQLSYFAIVFLAAPLAIVTGARISVYWPRKAERLNRLLPFDASKRVHVAVMVFFVAFIVVHVGLVLATGALRNLNHMYAAQDTVSWTGFWIFAASLLVIAAAWVAARPARLIPLARVFGDVVQR